MGRLAAIIGLLVAGIASGCATALEQGAASMAYGDYDGAAASYRQAIEENPGDVQAHLGLGLAYNRAGRFAYAVPVLRRALALAPTSSWAHYHLAYALENLSQLQPAAYEYRQTLQLDPQCVHCIYAMAFISRRLGNSQYALSALDDYLPRARMIQGESQFLRPAWVLRTTIAREFEAAAAAERQRAAAEEQRLLRDARLLEEQRTASPLRRDVAPPVVARTDQRDQAIAQIVVAFIGEAFRRDGEENGGLGGALEQGFGIIVRDTAIEGALELAFPDPEFTRRQRSYIQPLVASVFEGKLSPADLAKAEFRSIAVADLQEHFQDEAAAIKVANFLWDIKLKARKN